MPNKQVNKRLDAIKPFKMLDIDDESLRLAKKIISGKGIPEEYPADAFMSRLLLLTVFRSL